jgi:putative endonuclease
MKYKIMASLWYVYFLRCADSSLYAGITTDLSRRLDEHNFSKKRAAKYTRVRRPVHLVYSEQVNSRSAATQRECQLKKLSKKTKEQLVDNYISI